MSAGFRMEALAAFLAGAGLGAALSRRLPEPGSRPGGGGWGNLPGIRRAAPVAASLGRMQALLGEIRGLVGARSERSGMPGTPGGTGAEILAASETVRPPAAEASAGREAWRTPDRVGYGMRRGAADPGMLALCAAAAGSAAAYAALRKGGAAAAWPALAGFLAALAWAAAGGRMSAKGRWGLGIPAPLPGPRGGRSGRPAMP